MLVLILSLVVFHILLCIVAAKFAKSAQEDNWSEFALVMLAPIVGPIISVVAYSQKIQELKSNKE